MPSPRDITGWTAETPPQTASRVYYSYKITVEGTPIGTFHNFSAASARQVQRLRGIANNGGRVQELVPGNADDSITVNYFSLYVRGLQKALGGASDITSLNNFREYFDVTEQCFHPDGFVEGYVYQDCLASNFTRTVNTGSILVAENATIQVTDVLTA